jgi:hypothetical protein
MDMTRKTPRIQTSSVYLGDTEQRKEREAKLDALAQKHGIKNRSVLIQMIADGVIVVCSPSEAEKPQSN